MNDKLQTSNSNIYAVGDCCTRYRFTHMADFMVCGSSPLCNEIER